MTSHGAPAVPWMPTMDADRTDGFMYTGGIWSAAPPAVHSCNNNYTWIEDPKAA